VDQQLFSICLGICTRTVLLNTSELATKAHPRWVYDYSGIPAVDREHEIIKKACKFAIDSAKKLS